MVRGIWNAATALLLVVALVATVAFSAPAGAGTEPGWVQVGEDLVGSANDSHGRSVAISGDGLVSVVAATRFAGVGVITTWTRRGGQLVEHAAPLFGSSDFSGAGIALDLNFDGTRLAVGASSFDVEGAVRVFELLNGSWVQLGDGFEGGTESYQVGTEVSLSDDGSRLAVGFGGETVNGVNSGRVEIRDWTGSEWELVGSPILGEGPDNYAHWAFALSGDGRRIVLGSQFNDGAAGAGSEAGHARIFELIAGQWTQLGADLDGTRSFDGFGASVALSRDGSVAAIAAFAFRSGQFAGQVYVFQWNGATWQRRGQVIDGAASNSLGGQVVALDAAGSRLLHGVPSFAPPGTSFEESERGRVATYDWSGAEWVPYSAAIVGGPNDRLGASADLSAAGSALIVGAPGIGITGDTFGTAQVFAPGLTCQGRQVTIDMTAGASGVGTAGDDVILGTAGDDTIDGLDGNDTICAGEGNDLVTGGDGDDVMFGGDGRDTIRGNGGNDVIDGGRGADRLLGGIGDDELNGREGDDYIGGFGGADRISGGPGNEIIFGGFGADQISGDEGNDVIRGLIGDDSISGGPGNDTLDGDRGNDAITGGDGDDLIRGGNARDVLVGSAGDDTVSGGKADDTLSGGPGFDICSGNKHVVGDVADASCERQFGIP